jgi:hypothetical protein
MTIDQQLANLRTQWKLHPERREAIELQAKILKAAKTAPKHIPENQWKPVDHLEVAVKETLL